MGSSPSDSPLVAALMGGLFMGYGAWLAFGCNVGACFSSIIVAEVIRLPFPERLGQNG